MKGVDACMTIKDIARLAGVSIATVSRVLNGQSGVSEAKRLRVLQVIEEEHYSPSRFSQPARNQTPHLLVLQVDQCLTAKTEETVLHACLEALNNFQNQELKIEFFAAEELPQALEFLTELQERDESLEGLLIIGSPPRTLAKPLKYLRGKGCPMIHATNESLSEDKLAPVNVIGYDKEMYYQLITELILANDKQKTGLFIHESRACLSGEGHLSEEGFTSYVDQLKAHYPEKSVFVHNKGRFTPDLLFDASCVVTDSTKASEDVVRHFTGEKNPPLIIAYGNSDPISAALETGLVDFAIHFSPYELAFCSMAVLLQRLLLKRTQAKELLVYPRVFSKASLPLLNQSQKYPALITTVAYN